MTLFSTNNDKDQGIIFIDTFIKNIKIAKGDCDRVDINNYLEISNYTKDQKDATKELYCIQISSIYQRLDSDYDYSNIFNYKAAKKKNLKGFFEIDDNDLKNVYFVRIDNNSLLPVKLNEKKDKILAMTAFKKGGKIGYFLGY